MTKKMPPSMRRIFHVPKGTAYTTGNSSAGMRWALRHFYRWIDWDANITSDNVVVIIHWPKFCKDGFLYKVVPKRVPGAFRVRDEWLVKHGYGRETTVSDLTWTQVSELRTATGRFIRTARQMFRLAARHHLNVALEVKGDRRFERTALMRGLHRSAELEGAEVIVMTLQNLGNPELRLKAAKEAGFTTVLLARGRVPRAWEPFIDYVRGKWVRA